MNNIQAPYVLDTIIRLSNAKHGPIQITSVDAENTHSDVHIQIQTVKSVAGRHNVRSTRLNGMPSCTAEARSLYTDIAARREGRSRSMNACWLHVLTHYSRRRHTAMYSIQAPYVFVKIIRLSKAKHGPMQITTVDEESTHRDARIQMQTVKSAAERPCQQHTIE